MTRGDFLNDGVFRQSVQQAYDSLYDQLEDLLERLEEEGVTESDAFEPNLSSGSLTVNFEDGSVFMLSQQTPTHEIWLSANYTAWHFLFVSGKWIERDTKVAMTEVLSKLFSEKIGTEVLILL